MTTSIKLAYAFFFSTGLSFLFAITISWKQGNSGNMIEEDFRVAEKQYTQMLNEATDLTCFPRTSNKDGTLKYVKLEDWTSGFWAGNLWYMYDYTKKEKWKNAAIKWTEALKDNQYLKSHHDIGFMMYCSYGNGYRLTGNSEYKDILIQSAKSLCKRYSSKVGAIQSWNARKSIGNKNTWEYPVIIDNMMNLELLFFASELTGDSSYRNIAIRHADNTMENHIRPDFSTYHVVNYDKNTGNVLHQQTAQGFADNSTWARGQAWAIYGFTLMYRETKKMKYLETATKLADFYLGNKNLPKDKIPYWDFNAGQQGYVPDWEYDATKFRIVPRDASAAAITSSALLELSTYTNRRKRDKYYAAAVTILQSLSTDKYRAKPGTNNNFLLMHSVGNLPGNNEIDVPLVYADYYFLEALLRYEKLAESR